MIFVRLGKSNNNKVTQNSAYRNSAHVRVVHVHIAHEECSLAKLIQHDGCILAGDDRRVLVPGYTVADVTVVCDA